MKTMVKGTGHADSSTNTSQKDDTNKRKRMRERERIDQTMGDQKIFGRGGSKASRVTEKEKKHTYNFLVVCICGGFERAISWTTKEEGEKGWTIVD